MQILEIKKSDSLRGLKKNVVKGLRIDGYVIVKTETLLEDDSSKTVRNLLLWATLLGESLGASIGHHIIAGNGDNYSLPIHTEGIYYPDGLLHYFVLGCVQPATQGGETRIFDARKAAILLNERYPDLVEVSVDYTAKAHPDQHAHHNLVEINTSNEKVLVYRSRVETNTILNYTNESKLYTAVDSILEECVLVTHSWEVGDLLFVDNSRTLHDRLPYSGDRKMLRVRFDDQYVEATY